MELREKTHSANPTVSDADPSAADTRRAEERLQRASRLLAAGRTVVDRTLSNNSDTFLQQVRQQGGQ